MFRSPWFLFHMEINVWHMTLVQIRFEIHLLYAFWINPQTVYLWNNLFQAEGVWQCTSGPNQGIWSGCTNRPRYGQSFDFQIFDFSKPIGKSSRNPDDFWIVCEKIANLKNFEFFEKSRNSKKLTKAYETKAYDSVFWFFEKNNKFECFRFFQKRLKNRCDFATTFFIFWKHRKHQNVQFLFERITKFEVLSQSIRCQSIRLVLLEPSSKMLPFFEYCWHSKNYFKVEWWEITTWDSSARLRE